MPPDFVFVERANSLQLRTDALLAGNGDRVIVTAGPRFVPSTLPKNLLELEKRLGIIGIRNQRETRGSP